MLRLRTLLRRDVHLILEFVRADRASQAHIESARGERVYLLREPDDSARYAEGDFRWTKRTRDALAELDRPQTMAEGARRLSTAVASFLEQTPWERYRPLIEEALAEERSVVVTLRSAASELYTLPWEFLPIGEEALCRTPGCLLRYSWPDDDLRSDRLRAPESDPLEVVEPLRPGRVVVAWSATAGQVPAAAHIAAVREATSEARVPFDPGDDVLAHVDRDALQRRLARGDVDVLHVLCHGVRSAPDEPYSLALGASRADRDGRVSPTEFAELLRPFARSLRLVVIFACHGGNPGPPGSPHGSLAEKLHRAGVRNVVASRYPLHSEASSRVADRLHRSLLVDLLSLEASVLRARTAELEHADDFAYAALQLWGAADSGEDTRPLVVRPYRGLLPFEARHARFFFGREASLAELVARVEAMLRGDLPRWLLLAGSSGSGKSSLVQAGLVPAVLRGDVAGLTLRETDVVQLRPGEATADPTKLLQRLGERRPALLVVDQLEELFQEVDASARGPFLRALWDLARPERGVFVLGTLRIEFLGRFGEVPMDDAGRRFDSVSLDERHRLFVRRIDGAEIETIVRGPAELVGLRFEDGLVERLLKDAGSEPGALPLLSFTLDQLWKHRRGSVLRDATYDAFGGLGGALTHAADRLFAGLDSPVRSAEGRLRRAQARNLLVQLVHTAEDPRYATRRRASLRRVRPADPVEASAFDSVVATLTDGRLIVTGADDAGDGWVEIAHEALIREWETLQSWLREDRERIAFAEEIQATVDAWLPEVGRRREKDYLLKGVRLAIAEAAWAKHRPFFGKGDRERIGGFLAAGRAAETAGARVRRALLVVFVTAVTGAGLFAGYKAIEASQERALAEKAALQSDRDAEFADRSAEDARAQRDEAIRQTGIAKEQTAIAEEQTTIAEEKTALAEEQTAIATEEKARADSEAAEALRQRNVARREAAVARAGELAAAAREAAARGKPQLSLLLAAEAAEGLEAAGIEEVPAVSRTVLSRLAASPSFALPSRYSPTMSTMQENADWSPEVDWVGFGMVVRTTMSSGGWEPKQWLCRFPTRTLEDCFEREGTRTLFGPSGWALSLAWWRPAPTLLRLDEGVPSVAVEGLYPGEAEYVFSARGDALCVDTGPGPPPPHGYRLNRGQARPLPADAYDPAACAGGRSLEIWEDGEREDRTWRTGLTGEGGGTSTQDTLEVALDDGSVLRVARRDGRLETLSAGAAAERAGVRLGLPTSASVRGTTLLLHQADPSGAIHEYAVQADRSARRVRTLEGHETEVGALFAEPGGRGLVSVGRFEVRVWALGEPHALTPSREVPIPPPSTDPHVLAKPQGGQYDPCPMKMQPRGGGVHACAGIRATFLEFHGSPDIVGECPTETGMGGGNQILAATPDRTGMIRFLDQNWGRQPGTHLCILRFEGRQATLQERFLLGEGGTAGLAMHPDGTAAARLLAPREGDTGRPLQVFSLDPARFGERRPLNAGDADLTIAALAADVAVAADTDGVVWYWPSTSDPAGVPIARHPGPVHTLTLTPDGSSVSSAGGGLALETSLKLRDWLPWVEPRVGRELTAVERRTYGLDDF